MVSNVDCRQLVKVIYGLRLDDSGKMQAYQHSYGVLFDLAGMPVSECPYGFLARGQIDVAPVLNFNPERIGLVLSYNDITKHVVGREKVADKRHRREKNRGNKIERCIGRDDEIPTPVT